MSMLLVRALPGQQTVHEGDTLHVYTNLLQIPVLILDKRHQAVPPIPPGQFLLRLGKDPPFRPVHVRMEGDDPLTLAILIDGSRDGAKLPGLDEALESLASRSLRPGDRVALYGTDGCLLRRAATMGQADPAVLRRAAQSLAAFPPAQTGWNHRRCPDPVGLWDAMTWAVQSLQHEPGRRVVLAITDGMDSGSRTTPDFVRMAGIRFGVAVFCMSERFHVAAPAPESLGLLAQAGTSNELSYVSEMTGGMLLETTRNNVEGTILRFPSLLRGRYILEFQRPPGVGAGMHALTVSIGRTNDFIRSAGTSMPVSDPVAPDTSVQHATMDEVRRETAADHETAPDAAEEKKAPVPPDR